MTALQRAEIDVCSLYTGLRQAEAVQDRLLRAAVLTRLCSEMRAIRGHLADERDRLRCELRDSMRAGDSPATAMSLKPLENRRPRVSVPR